MRYMSRALLGLMAAAPLAAAGGCMDEAVARAGADQTVDGGDTVTLDGSASSPKNTNRRQMSWEVVEGPEVTFSDSDGEVTTFTAPAGTAETRFLIRLTVTYVDYAGAPVSSNSDSDEVVVRVRAAREDDGPDEADEETSGDAAAAAEESDAAADGAE